MSFARPLTANKAPSAEAPRWVRWFVVSQIVLAATLGFSRHFWGVWLNNGAYTPFAHDQVIGDIVWDEGYFYLESANVFARHGDLGTELDNFEARKRKSIYPPLWALLVGLLIRLVGSADLVWLSFSFVVLPIGWLVFYHIGRRCGLEPVLASAVSFITLLFGFEPRSALLLSPFSFENPLRITRVCSPGFTYSLLIFYFVLLDKAIQAKRAAISAMVVTLGASFFYLYYFNWIIVSFTLLAAVVFYHCRKDRSASLIILRIGIATLILAIPFFMKALYPDALARETILMRMGTFHRSISWMGLLWMFVGVFGACLVGKKESLPRLPVSCRSLLGLLCIGLSGIGMGMNLQLVTNFDAQHSHFHFMLNSMLLFLALVLFCRQLKARLKRKLVWGLSVCALVLISFGFYRHYKLGVETAVLHSRNDSRNQAMQFLRDKVPERSVIGSIDRALIAFIPSITGHWGFVPSGLRTMTTDSEIALRFTILAKWFGLSKEEWQARQSIANLHSTQAHQSMAYTLFGVPKMVPSQESLLANAWDSAPSSFSVGARRLDYVVVEADLAERWSKNNPASRRVYANTDWIIFRIDRAASVFSK